MEKKACEIWLAVNEDGDYEVGIAEDEATERLTENIGGYCCKLVKLTVMVTAPKVENVDVDVPDAAGKTTVTAD